MRFTLRKGFRPGFYASTLSWIYDLILIFFNIGTWASLYNQSCGIPQIGTVMLYSNLLATFVLMQSYMIYSIVSASIGLHIVTGCQYRAFTETIKHALTYHTPELSCQKEIVTRPDKDTCIMIARSLNTNSVASSMSSDSSKESLVQNEAPRRPQVAPLQMSQLLLIKNLEVKKASESSI